LTTAYLAGGGQALKSLKKGSAGLYSIIELCGWFSSIPEWALCIVDLFTSSFLSSMFTIPYSSGSFYSTLAEWFNISNFFFMLFHSSVIAGCSPNTFCIVSLSLIALKRLN
jgi:hypothetical protein